MLPVSGALGRSRSFEMHGGGVGDRILFDAERLPAFGPQMIDDVPVHLQPVIRFWMDLEHFMGAFWGFLFGGRVALGQPSQVHFTGGGDRKEAFPPDERGRGDARET